MDLNKNLEKINAIKGIATGLLLEGRTFALVGDDIESLKGAFAIIHPATKFDESRCERVLLMKEIHLSPTKKKK